MNDQQIDDLVAAAARCSDRTVAGLGLRGAQGALLDEIVRPAPRHRTAVLALATAAAVAAMVAVPTLVAGGRDRTPPVEPASTSLDDPAGYTAAVLRAAEKGPRLLLTTPGWSLENLDAGSMSYHRGAADTVRKLAGGGADRVQRGQDLEIDWVPAGLYASRRKDRSHVSVVQQVPVLATTGRMVTYARDDHAVLLPPSRGTFLEIRVQGVAGPAAFLRLLAELRQVDATTWLAALPGSVLVPRNDGSPTETLLAGVPLPPGVDVADATPGAAEDYYPYGAHVAGAVACGWLGAWVDAKASGDVASQQRAVTALTGSRTWPVLRKMDADGDYPEVLWGYADQVAAGQDPTGYRTGLGCGQ